MPDAFFGIKGYRVGRAGVSGGRYPGTPCLGLFLSWGWELTGFFCPVY